MVGNPVLFGRCVHLAVLSLAGLLVCPSACLSAQSTRAMEEGQAAFVRVSPRDSRYFELDDGRTYVPIGLNMIAPPGDGLDGMERWLEKLARNKGNFIRVCLSNPFFDVEHARSGRPIPRCGFTRCKAGWSC